jgi:hypothetical protein
VKDAIAYASIAGFFVMALLSLAGCCVVIGRLVDRRKHLPPIVRPPLDHSVLCNKDIK